MRCSSLNGFDLESGKKINQFPCGKCPSCRVNHRRKWTSRIILETLAADAAAWVTLSYDDEHLPDDGELVPDHLTKFINKFRRKQGDTEKPIRFFGVGEYGDSFGRPHYHVIIWNYSVRLQVDPKDPRRWFDHAIEAAWGKGGTYSEDLLRSNKLDKRISYAAGYTLKKMRNPYDKAERKQPEFARMSRMPAIGTPAVCKIADALTTRAGCEILAALGTVPNEFRYNNKMWPIPRILRDKIGCLLDIPVLPIPRQIEFTNGLSFDPETGTMGYGPKAQPEEDTPAKAFARWEAMDRRLRREALSRISKHPASGDSRASKEPDQ